MFFFFVVAPFCSCPASLVSRKFFAVGPGCAKCFFFLLRSVGRRDLSAGPEQKKKTPPRVFFFCSGPGERQGKEKPRADTGPEQKKNTTQGVFFLLRPRRKAREGEAPLGAGTGPEQKKKHRPGCFFFCCGPARTLTHSLRAWVAMPPPRRGGVFFLLRPRPDRGGDFFFAVAPPGRSLTHCGLGRFRQGPGGVFFFCCGPAGSF